MARSKEQWRAEKRALQAGLKTKPRTPVAGIAAPWAPHVPLARASPPPPPVASVVSIKTEPTFTSTPTTNASVIIDLTADNDDEEDEDVALVDDCQPSGGVREPVVSSPVEQVALADVTILNNTTIGREEPNTNAKAPVTVQAETFAGQEDDEESDVDEAWPLMRRDDGAANVEETLADKDTGDGEDGGGVEAEPAQPHEPEENSMLAMDDDEMEVDEELPSGVETVASIHEEDTTSPDSGERIVRLADAPVEEENLEDGEILEEGAVVTSPTTVKRAIAMERMISREDSSSSDTSATRDVVLIQQPKVKKHKKRGKKKSKRKLETMMAEPAPAGFERITRQQRLSNPPPGMFGEMSMVAGSSQGQAFPPPLQPQSVPHPPFPPHLTMMATPHRHLVHPGVRQPPLPPPLPPYGDNQILRVNRQGSVEMFSGNMAPLARTTQPLDTVLEGGFKYRTVTRQHPPGRGRLPPSPDSSASNSPKPGVEAPSALDVYPRAQADDDDRDVQVDEASVLDLDSLRAAALRSKRTLREPALPSGALQTENEPAARKSSEVGASEENAETTTPDIDDLRAEILRSMKAKRKQMSNKSPSTNHPSQTALSTPSATAASVDNSRATLNEQDGVQDSRMPSSEPVKPESLSAKSSGSATKSSEQTSPLAVDTVDASISQDKEQSDPDDDVPLAPPTPIVRPLTACSQSLVIKLSAEDFVLDDQSVLDSPQAPTVKSVEDIRASIEAMRKQIADRERARDGGSAVPTPLASPSSSSSASSSNGNSLRASPRGEGEKQNVSKASSIAPAVGRKRPANAVFNPVVSASTSSSSGVSGASKRGSPAALQAEIRAMKDRIAAKEKAMERQRLQKRQPTAESSIAAMKSKSSSSSTSTTTTASSEVARMPTPPNPDPSNSPSDVTRRTVMTVVPCSSTAPYRLRGRWDD